MRRAGEQGLRRPARRSPPDSASPGAPDPPGVHAAGDRHPAREVLFEPSAHVGASGGRLWVEGMLRVLDCEHFFPSDFKFPLGFGAGVTSPLTKEAPG